MSLISSGMEFNTGISKASSGSTTAHLSSLTTDGISFVWPTEDGTLITSISGIFSPSKSISKACGKSWTFLDMKKEDLLSGFLTISPE